MKENAMLRIASLLHGIEKGGLSNLAAIPTFVVWLYGTLVLAERRSGYITTLPEASFRWSSP
jgi:hypothetical protein